MFLLFADPMRGNVNA